MIFRRRQKKGVPKKVFLTEKWLQGFKTVRRSARRLIGSSTNGRDVKTLGHFTLSTYDLGTYDRDHSLGLE
jgi:hypothetical protein